MRILIVDDDYVSRTKLKALFSSYGDCDVAPNGKLALALFDIAGDEGMPYDLISLDVEMPGLTGQDVVREVRKLEKFKKIPSESFVKILMVTIKKDPVNVASAYHGGCTEYCPKPITPKNARKALQNMGLL